jgi:hypothetical protein
MTLWIAVAHRVGDFLPVFFVVFVGAAQRLQRVGGASRSLDRGRDLDRLGGEDHLPAAFNALLRRSTRADLRRYLNDSGRAGAGFCAMGNLPML